MRASHLPRSFQLLLPTALALAACSAPPPSAPATPAAAVTSAPTPSAAVTSAPTPATAPASALPPGHPPLPAAPPPPVPVEQDVALPLPLVGPGSAAELAARRALIQDPQPAATLERAFRQLFTVDRAARDTAAATAALTALSDASDPAVAALAARLLGYARLNTGFDAAGAAAAYRRAVALDPRYGEAHYALAFLLAPDAPAEARAHFDQAMALHIPDTSNLGAFFAKPAPAAPPKDPSPHPTQP